MRSTVVEVGPVTVRGPGPDSDLAGIAVAGIDDEITLVGDQPVAVADLWGEVLDAAAHGARRLTLVCPTWWTVEQCDRVRVAAIAVGAEVVVMQRVQAIGATLTSESWVVVEISDEVVVVSGAGAPGVTLARHAEDDLGPETVVRAVIAIAGASAEVAVDAPAEVVGATALGSAVMDGLRRRGAKVSLADARTWRVALTCLDTPAVAEPVGRRVRAGRLATGAAVTLVIVLGAIAFAAQGGAGDDGAMTVLVDGGVAMQIPAGWTVQRITDGPGSARVEVISPSDPQAAIHLTQSGIADGAVADTLQRALEEEPEGVFVDFDPAAVIAARRVVSYREVRPGREVRWAVFVDRSVRIAIGCQSAPDRAAAMRAACEAATRSAHATG